MIEVKSVINVWSDMNTWIDFCVIVPSDELDIAKAVVQSAYDDWWNLEGLQCETIGDYIDRCLYRTGIEYEMYFKNEEDSE